MTEETLRTQAPSIFATGPMAGLSRKYAFVPTAQIVNDLRAQDWVPVAVEEQRIRTETRRGFQKHLLRFRRAEQMETLDEWNVELVLLNSHDAGCAYQFHAGIYRRICSNGLVIANDSFRVMRFRHTGLLGGEIVQASLRLLDFAPRIGELVNRFRERQLEVREAQEFARHALLLRYESLAEAPIEPDTLLQAHRPEDEGADLWRALNRIQLNLVRGGVSDWHKDRRGKLRSVRALRGIDSKVTLNKGLWGLAERLARGEPLASPSEVALSA
ncbi:MAG: DUF932 domain-containing protein [Verrucomicrobia bacterium]|nr:DUF932 domain-containing protein [Verrucomicrobiota bacterium]